MRKTAIHRRARRVGDPTDNGLNVRIEGQVRDASAASLFEEAAALGNAIRERAFELFRQRDGAAGSALDDWLRAESELVWPPAFELADEGNRFSARVAVPGFGADDIRVSALPKALVIKAESAEKRTGAEQSYHFSEFSGKKLFRRIVLPSPVEVDKVTASLGNGILQVAAPKAPANAKKATRAKAAGV